MSSTAPFERRTAVRLALGLPISLTVSGAESPRHADATVVDLSAVGMRLEADAAAGHLRDRVGSRESGVKQKLDG